MKLCLSLRQELRQDHKMPSPILGLSPLEMELLLDNSLQSVQEFHDSNPNWRGENPPEQRGNYFLQRDFLNSCKAVRGKVPRERYLSVPQVFAELNENGYAARYNPEISGRIAKKLGQFKNPDGQRPPSSIFSRQFAKTYNWMAETQAKIAQYLCNEQSAYIETRSPFDLKPMTQQIIGNHIGHDDSTISYLIRSLTLQLPSMEVIFASELVPGYKLLHLKGIYALRQLQLDSDLYGNGEWKASDEKLMPILKEKFGLDIARRTISKYRCMLRELGETEKLEPETGGK